MTRKLYSSNKWPTLLKNQDCCNLQAVIQVAKTAAQSVFLRTQRILKEKNITNKNKHPFTPSEAKNQKEVLN